MIKRTCKQCGKDFTLTDSEVNFYKSKDLELPKRCSDCRKKNNNSSTKEINSNIGKSEDGLKVLNVLSHIGYQYAQSSDYDAERAAQNMLKK